MIVFPHAKINLGLNVVARRADGFHDIETVLVPIPLYDVLEAIIDPALGPNELTYTRSGLPIPGEIGSDLCYRAVRMLQNVRPLPGIRLHLHKVIPMGAGLGGGSSDGAQALQLVNRICGLGLDQSTLRSCAAQLGSDCAFFLEEGPCIARGRGELLEPIDLDLRGLQMILVNPGLHVGTAEVYGYTAPTGSQWDLSAIARRERMVEWQSGLANTMEAYVTRAYPLVGEVKAMLLGAGAVYAAMSGSGSSVFGLFSEALPELALPAGCRSWTFAL